MRSEFDFIRSIRRRFNVPKIGDDCAVLPMDAQRDLVITSDLLVEDVDFRRGWVVPEFLGHKALAVSLSDVAAMGAKPLWAMLSIGVPLEIWKTDFVDRFYDGWFVLAERFGVNLVGGDVSKTPDFIVIDSIAAGECATGRAILRSSARPGDLIFVSGELGGAAFGLKMLEIGERFEDTVESSAKRNLLLRSLSPTPRTEIGQLLGTERVAAAMIDLSDGLAGDLGHICRQSGVGAKIFVEKIPVDRNLAEAAPADAEILNLAIAGGEDFELLFTVRPADAERIRELSLNGSVNLSHIGEITSSAGKIEVVSADGSSTEAPQSFIHF